MFREAIYQIAWMLVSLCALAMICPNGHAAGGANPMIGAEGSCDESVFGDGLVGRFTSRLTLRPVLAPQDGSRRLAAVSTVRVTPHGKVKLQLRASMSFANGVPVAGDDLQRSIISCGVDVAEVSAGTPMPGGEVELRSTKELQAMHLDTLRRCPLRSAQGELNFGELHGVRGAYLASGPYEISTLKRSSVSFVRFGAERGGQPLITLGCSEDVGALVAAVRAGELSAAYLKGAAGAGAAARLKTGDDETVTVRDCPVAGGNGGYHVLSRQSSISCIEGLDPLAIIAG